MEAALFVSGAHNNQKQPRGEAPVAGRPPNPLRQGSIPCAPASATSDDPDGLSRRANSTLKIEEIASKGIDGRDVCHRATPRRSISAGRRRGTAPGRNPGASARQVRLLPRGLRAQRTSGGAPPLQGGRRRFESVWVHWAGRATILSGRSRSPALHADVAESVDALASEASGPGP